MVNAGFSVVMVQSPLMTIENHRLKEATWLASPNHGGKLRNPKYVVIHATGGRKASDTARWLSSKGAKASAHVIVGRDASIFQLVPLDTVAWHAGASQWGGLKGLNNHSLSIELDGPGPLRRVNGRWRSLTLGTDYPDSEVVEFAHHLGGPVLGWLLYTPVQLALCEHIVREMVEAYPTIVDMVGHDDIAVPRGRKNDPSDQFPMEEIRTKVFGRQ